MPVTNASMPLTLEPHDKRRHIERIHLMRYKMERCDEIYIKHAFLSLRNYTTQPVYGDSQTDDSFKLILFGES